MAEEKYRMGGVIKALEVLEIISEAGMPLHQIDIVKVSGLNQNQVLRILKTLQLKGWVKKQNKCWCLGEKAWLVWGWICKKIEKMRELE